MPHIMLATMVLPLLLLVVLLKQTLPVSSFHHVSGTVVRRRQQPISFHNRRRSIDSILSNAISRTTNAGAVTSTSTSFLEGKSWYSDPDFCHLLLLILQGDDAECALSGAQGYMYGVCRHKLIIRFC